MTFDKSKFIDQFKAETKEHIEALNLGLLKLEKNPKNAGLLKEMMRQAHSIKGSSVMMGYNRISEIAHSMESGLEKAMKGELELAKQHIDILLKAADSIGQLLSDKVAWEEKGIDRPFTEKMCREIEDTFSGATEKAAPRDAKTPKPGKEEFREEIPTTIEMPPESRAAAHQAGPEDSLRVGTDKLNAIMNISGELLISKIRLKEIVRNLRNKVDSDEALERPLGTIAKELQQANENIDYLTASMQNEVMKVRMVPASYLFSIFPRSMRDLAHTKGKDIDFQITGEDTQLDKAIIDELKDPIMHILRNALDHGIESAAERSAAGKPERGRVILAAYQEGSQVVIEVSDDGRGVDIEKVKERAAKKGIVAGDKIGDMADEQFLQLLFLPGFTTKETASDISGRGVGLDVVRDKVVKLKGTVEVLSEKGAGSRFIMRLPLTLAITESLMVGAGGNIFAIPVAALAETIRIRPEDIKTIETKDAIVLRGIIMPSVRLNDIFGLPRKGIIEKRFLPMVIVQSAEKKIGIQVDELLGRQEIVIKSLGDPLQNVRHIAGATILGSGQVVLILDIPSIIEAAEGVIIKRPAPLRKAAVKTKKKTILLAEDVLTTAMLEKNILESVGYSVVIARDGRDALDKAQQEKFDLVITDVLMPRMDGFELVENLRASKLYKDVPIVIVTTRETDADKRRGMEAGADAYILKSDFTSEGLLSTLEKLLG